MNITWTNAAPLPKLIAIDMDGTLLGADGKVSARNLAALQLAEEQGAEIVIATGRRHSYAMQALRGLPLRSANALISSNGTVIRTVGAKLLHRRHIALSTAQWLCDHIGSFRSTLLFTFDKVGPDGEDKRGALLCESMDDLHASIGRWMKANEAYLQHVPSLAEVFAKNAAESQDTAEETSIEGEASRHPIQAMLCGPVDRMRAAEAHLLTHPAIVSGSLAVEDLPIPGAQITLHRTEYPDRDLCIVDILPAGCSKASALQELTRMRGITMGDVFAIGDNWNDLPMLRLAGRAALMGNAPEDLKAMAAELGWTLAPTNDGDGVAVVLEALFRPGLEDEKKPGSGAFPDSEAMLEEASLSAVLGSA